METRHVTFESSGVRVTFPFEPYDIQREYIDCVIRAAKNRQNALLESPTGTGKTLSLLCSSLAWQQNFSAPNKMIYFMSRTHIQLEQAAKEMKRTAYARVPAVVLASRTHMCLNDEVKAQCQDQDQAINRACHNAIKKNSCVYYSNYEQKLETKLDVNNVHDIEDLYNFGRANKCCPYYASKKIADKQASLVFMPYNYLLDLSMKNSQLRLDNSILIFDEGHNIEGAFKDSASGMFTQLYLETIRDSCSKLPQKLNDALNYELHGLSRSGYDPEKRRVKNVIVDEFKSNSKTKSTGENEKEHKANILEELSEKLTNDRLQQVNKCAEHLLYCRTMMKSKEGQYKDTKCSLDLVYLKFGDSNINYKTSDIITDTLDAMASFWSIASVMNPMIVAKYLNAITSFSHFISLLFPSGMRTIDAFTSHAKRLKEYYSAYLRPVFESDDIFAKSNKLINWEMNLWCLHPAIGLKRVVDNCCVMGPRSIIITSGTLAPMRPIEQSLEVKFDIVREFKHLIKDEQLKIVIISESPGRYPLTSTYEETRKPLYSNALGESLLSLFKLLPFGTLVFFPSYSLMNRVTKYWKDRIIWKDMCREINLYEESKQAKTFAQSMDRYKRDIDSGGKAAFFGVCRGKLSEGTNLEGNHCRNVIIVGLPFPSTSDPKVLETKIFHSRRGDPKGQTWYTQQMRRALSQAIGRVIRGKSDFGMLFLCDPRFTQYRMTLSQWIRPFYPVEPTKDIRSVAEDVKKFFAQYGVDISNVSIAKSVCNQNDVFELEPQTKSKCTKTITSSSANQESSNPQRFTLDIPDPEPPRTHEERRRDMLASYTVSREKFNEVKRSRAPGAVAVDDGREVNKPTEPKKPRTTAEAFDYIFSSDPNPTPAMVGGAEAPLSREETAAAKPAKVMKVKPKITAAGQFTCYVCKNPAIMPYVINCPCARIGCLSCLKGLNNKSCGECNIVLKAKRFKPKLFNLFQKKS